MRRVVAAVLAAAALTLSACGGAASPSRSSPATSAPAAPTTRSVTTAAPAVTTARPTSAASRPGCPATYAAPDLRRPRLTLTFVVSKDLATVTGTEQISFTPDLPITNLAFRLTANTASSVAEGNSIKITSAASDHGAGPYRFQRANAAARTQGGILLIPMAAQVAAGTRVRADIAFTLHLGAGSFDRFGRVEQDGQRYAWFGSAEPLLAWERGFGWHMEDLIGFTAESATSEAMDTTLTVIAPAGDVVIASGNPTKATRQGATRTWTGGLAAARDVNVAVGPFQVSDLTVNGVKLRVAAYDAAIRDALVPEFRRAIVELGKRYGPFPFPSLAVARVPASGGGIEYPGSILMLDGARLVAVHETAHQYFYAMVGNSQALHPWLDEAMAQASEELIDGTAEPGSSLAAAGSVDRSTESYGTDSSTYYFVTYHKGAAALEAARTAAGAAKWDAAMRCYVAKNAWRIANPSDLRAAISDLPAAVAVLRKAGALA